MIIKGKSRSAAGQAGAYLLNQKKNDRAELIEIKNTISANVKDAMREMEAVASGSKCKDFLYHASINPKEGEHLTPEQWAEAVELLAVNLGLENHQRVVVEHEKDGRTHRHILFNRVDPETGKAVRMSHNFRAHELTARELERRFDLEHTQGRHVLETGTAKADRGPTHKEIQQAEKTGVNLYQWRQEIRDILSETLDADPAANSHELAAALEAKGHMVARGEKVDFLILDPSGTPHRMAQSLNLKIRNGDFAEHFGDTDPASLPSVEHAQERQKEYQAAQQREQEEKARAGNAGATLYDSGRMVDQQADALRHVKDKVAAREKGADPAAGDRGGITLDQMLLKQARQRAGRDGNAEPMQYQSLKDEGERAANEALAKQAREAAANSGNVKEGQNEGLREQKKEGRAIGKEKPQAEVKREEKKARTEQTDTKQRKSAADVMKEIFETDFSKMRIDTGNDRDRGDGRERERER